MGVESVQTIDSKIKARIYRHGRGFGVQFVDLNEEQTEKLLRLLQIARDAGPEAPAICADLVED